MRRALDASQYLECGNLFGKGSIAFELAAQDQWPPRNQVEIHHNQTSEPPINRTLVTLKTSGCILVEIFGDDGSIRKLESPEVVLEEGAEIRLAFRWSEGDAALAIDGNIVARFPASDTPIQEPMVIRSYSRSDPQIEMRLREMSTTAQVSRRQRELGLQPPPAGYDHSRKRLRTLIENLRALRERTLALAEVTESTRQGRDHHLFAVAATLRLLVCKAGGTHRALLLRVAGLLDMPLWVYGLSPDIHQTAGGHFPDHADYSLLRADGDSQLYKMDLEVWLANDGYCFQGQTKSNNELLKLLGNEDGAHFDPCVSPEVEFWESIVSAGSPLRRNILLRTALAIVLASTRLTNSVEAQNALQAGKHKS